ncbi:MAG: YhcH/YjgK/YiaL family protein [Armatimonadetes bacterium]|nr:YhcH/YjgK/YiaL family protein [Armatimonadota bacterium]
MILDRLQNAGRYVSIHPGFVQAFKYIRQAQESRPPLGRHDIDGDRIYAIAASSISHGKDKAKLEAHRKYIDIQFTVEGLEVYGWNSMDRCKHEAVPFSEAQDIGFYTDAPESWITAPPGSFVVFFPEDAHAPACGEGNVFKVVVKIALEG